MRVAIVSKSDAAGGGAGRMAQSLRAWLREDFHEVVQFARWGGEPFDSTFRPAFGRSVNLVKRIEVRTLMNETLPLEIGSVLRRLRRYRPDVVHFHDLTTAYNVHTVRVVAGRYPTVWTLHDQSPMTGGCITAHPCERYLVGCGQCPRFPSWCLNGRIDFTARVQRQKRQFFRTGRAELTAPSRAAVERLLSSGVLEGRTHIHVVPNGLDTRAVRAVDQAAARRWLGLPSDRLIIALVTYDLDDALKNPPSQTEALRTIADLHPLLLIVGNSTENPGARYAPNDVKNIGFVTSEPLMNAIYAAADVFVNTSLGDTFSLTTLESLAAGTPVVAYASGGIPEIIVDGQTGALVPADDGAQLAATLRAVITSGKAASWRRASRSRAETFGHRRVVDDYLGVYQQAISRFRT